jgi:hypothetical protein
VPLEPLDTTHGDKYSHQGWNLGGGLRAGAPWEWGQWHANAGLLFYARSDDLNPGGDDAFGVADLRFANVFQPWVEGLHPALELTYFGDFSNINQPELIPELLFRPSELLEFKAGAIIGLGGNGNELGGKAQLDLHF